MISKNRTNPNFMTFKKSLKIMSLEKEFKNSTKV